MTMAITGIHTMLYTTDAEALRALLRDVFGFPYVDSGGGWLIFRTPPAELGVHPAHGPAHDGRMPHEISFMCDDLEATIAELREKGVEVVGEPKDEGFGITVTLHLPGGAEVTLYEPRHPRAIDLED